MWHWSFVVSFLSQRTTKRASTPSGTSRRSPTTPCPLRGTSTRRPRYTTCRELPIILYSPSEPALNLVTLLAQAPWELIWDVWAELKVVQVCWLVHHNPHEDVLIHFTSEIFSSVFRTCRILTSRIVMVFSSSIVEFLSIILVQMFL